jgi:cytochrome P450
VPLAHTRTAIEDVELAGVEIPSGTLIVVNTRAANRDPAVYDDPDRLDIRRQGASPSQTFGGGTHYCLGGPTTLPIEFGEL